ncbi:MAG: alanine racemase [Proteobacteria bacterium]|nr:alanine racemase [Pseudomonadota bacterium]
MSRTATAILSTENLLHNLTVIKEKVKGAKIIAMVKANAYGHGIRSVALRLDKHVDMLGVASIDEAMALRKIGVNAPILLSEGIFEPNELLVAATEKFHVVFHNELQVEWLEKASLPLPLEAWIKINTGMGRLGFELEQAKKFYKRIMDSSSIVSPVKVMSHFACSDDKDHPLNQQQIHLFKDFIKDIQSEFSLCNSGGIFNFPEYHYDYVRPGLALYGISPLLGKSAQDLNLKPVMTLQTSLISTQVFKKGSSVGYGARYQCPEDMPVGIIAFGYGDGYPITAQDGTPILVNNIECSLIGRVSMDMIAVDLRHCPHAKIGDPVVLWGADLPLERVVSHTSNITWDLLTGVQNRVKFLWTRLN